jgi:hypothetical protein
VSQVFGVLAGLKHGGAASLVSMRRRRPSSNRLPVPYRDLALSLVCERYADFGPTLAAEKLAEVHGSTILALLSLPVVSTPNKLFRWCGRGDLNSHVLSDNRF